MFWTWPKNLAFDRKEQIPWQENAEGFPGLSFSWKRALGITAAKQRIARATGIPTTKAGRQQKIGRMLTGGGCLFPVLSLITLAALLIVAVFG